MRKSFVITAGRDSNGQTFRFTVGAHALVVVVLLVIGFPALFFAGTSWGASAMISDLLRQNAALQAENANYRDATAQLAAQVIEPAGRRRHAPRRRATRSRRSHARWTGCRRRSPTGRWVAASFGDLASPVSSTVTAGDPAFGLLRDVLHVLQAQLDRFRPGAERRQALAAATPSIWPVAGGLSSHVRHPDATRSRAPRSSTPASTSPPDRDSRFRPPPTERSSAPGGAAASATSWSSITASASPPATGTSPVSRSSEGQQIRKGDIVGYVGSTGRSTSPHVHYELLLNGRPANPLRLLAR